MVNEFCMLKLWIFKVTFSILALIIVYESYQRSSVILNLENGATLLMPRRDASRLESFFRYLMIKDSFAYTFRTSHRQGRHLYWKSLAFQQFEIIDLCLPGFVADTTSEETKLLKTKYRFTRKAIIQSYEGKNFLEATLSLF